jgi:hypothetical protein
VQHPIKRFKPTQATFARELRVLISTGFHRDGLYSTRTTMPASNEVKMSSEDVSVPSTL